MKHFLLLSFVFLFSASLVAQSSVFDIARKGTLSDLEQLHKKFPDSINTRNDAGYTPLILACYHGNNEVASFLASHCKDINGSSAYGTPLMAAVVKKNETMVSQLLALNADPNISDTNETTALHYAVLFQMDSIIALLMKSNADPLLKDNKGFTALDYANKTKNEKIINLLIKKS